MEDETLTNMIEEKNKPHRLQSFKGSRIYGNDKKELLKEVKFRKKLQKKHIGFTNKMAVYILLLITIGLGM